MSAHVRRRLRRSLDKNLPEVRAITGGHMPAFVTAPRPSPLRDIPVFTFHAVEPASFEAQLRFLTDNGYRTITADEWVDAAPSSPETRVVLTFDDADWTFWAYAYPLLREYGHRAVLFVTPGLVDPSASPRPNQLDVEEGRMTDAELAATGTADDVCSWPELRAMHESGVVDIQAHSMTHACIPVSGTIVDFVRRDLGYRGYKWVNVPISSLDDETAPGRAPRWGAPIFESRPRLSGAARFIESREFARELIDAASAHDGSANLVATLRDVAARHPEIERGHLEPPDATAAAIHRELDAAKRTLERELEKSITHHCHPWFVGSDAADRTARDLGYRAVYYGIDAPPRDSLPGILRVRRLSEHFLRRLPGSNRASLWSIFRQRLSGPRV